MMAQSAGNAGQADSRDPSVQLEGGTYEVIRNRLLSHGKELRARLAKLNALRKEVFGSIETTLIGSERITTDNNCVPRDMVPVGSRFLFGYNVFLGLRSEMKLADVFAVYEFKDHTFQSCDLALIADETFQQDFRNLYRYFKNTAFAKFAVRGPHLFMVFRVGAGAHDIKTFKWLLDGGRLKYVDNRSDHEFRFPPQHEFEWTRTHRDLHRAGLHPHISIADRVFVEAIGGDLTIKIEDNTATGEGIYSEPVDNPDQTLDDAEIFYACVGNIILLKIRPYQEEKSRYIVYNEKISQAVRIDAVEDSCVLLPDGHGLIFPSGYYLQTGERKVFETGAEHMVFEERLASPNGEDFLYVFYDRLGGTYRLLSYNLIAQKVESPITCHGYSLFDNGELIYFRAQAQPQKHHVVQIWQTPYVAADHAAAIRTDSYLYKIGNKDVVRCMAECGEVLTLVQKEDTYAGLYLDLVKKTTDIVDSYFWLGSAEAGDLAGPLSEIRSAAAAAVEEFDKVVRVRRATRQEVDRVSRRVEEIVGVAVSSRLDRIDAFVSSLTDLRAVRGEVISLKALRYVDPPLVESLEKRVEETAEHLSGRCVEFLLTAESLAPYAGRIAEQAALVPALQRGAEAARLQEELDACGGELEMLIEVVSNLKIADPTQTTQIVDRISGIYSSLNQVKSALKNRRKELLSVEAVAEFNAQIKLINQGVINYLDVSDTPAKCDEYLTRLMVQVEGLESKFAEFDEFIVQLAEKREELYTAFESRKVQLMEARARRASALMTAAQRMLKGIRNRADAFAEINEINGYFASDLMVDRVRDTIRQLSELGDTVKADDVQGRLKTIQEDAVRQLKDRQALYEEGDNVIRLGDHRFSVNRQPLELTTVVRDGEMYFHLTGTGFFEKITDERFLATRDVWDMAGPSETAEVYRGEYLAFQMLASLRRGEPMSAEAFRKLPADEARAAVQQFMGPRYAEGYVKGVHDHDAAILLRGLLGLRAEIDLLSYSTRARALAAVFWQALDDPPTRQRLAAKGRSVAAMSGLFGPGDGHQRYVAEIAAHLREFLPAVGVFEDDLLPEAAEYLLRELTRGEKFVISRVAADALADFQQRLKDAHRAESFAQAVAAVASEPVSAFLLIRDWVGAFLAAGESSGLAEYADEVAAALFRGRTAERPVVEASVVRKLTGLVGSHPLIDGGARELNYCHFMARLRRHEEKVVPLHRLCQALKKELTEQFARQLRLEEFEPHVLTSFVRNKLIDKVYLPLVGDDLAKQIGVVGAETRTDRMGLLLLISPPGYGKTTLMEYIANRLGLTFIKINGPAVGNQVTSLDPAEAPNASAREELVKLNLSLEMGDNIMLYVDDIQHCNPEFLQKFISLCDAQRKIEGVYKGRTRTYDLRGKKVAVVMAGNPYTESGGRFKVPDMLANRADTYNLGDILGGNQDVFVMSYLENCLTSNPVLSRLAVRSQNDVYAVMRIAETGSHDGVEFEGNYSVEEINEYVATMTKLMVVRDVVLKVNQEYIRSAGMEEQYRTAPPFRLQGSYRNMNRIASKVLPVLNDEELWTLIYSSYENDAQTLTTGAEANLLKFGELVGRLSAERAKRWEDIKKTFRKNLLFAGVGADDKLGLVIRQLGAFSDSLGSIKDVLAGGLHAVTAARAEPPQPPPALPPETVARLDALLAELRTKRTEIETQAAMVEQVPKTLVAVLEEQFDAMETWLTPVMKSAQGRAEYIQSLIERFATMVEGYSRLIDVLKERKQGIEADGDQPEQPPKPAKRRKKD